MKIRRFFIFLIALFVLIVDSYCLTNETEEKFKKAGLIDVHTVDDNGSEIDMGFSPFYKSDISIYSNYAKLKVFNLSEKQKNNQKLLSNIMKKRDSFL